MASTMSTVLRKVVTEKEIKSGRIALPAMVRDRFFPHVPENSKTPVTVEDENGESHDIVVKVRDNGTKPEIMARGGRKFVLKRKLSPGDALVFPDGESGDPIRLKVEKRARLSPPARLGAFGFLIGFAQAPFVQEPPPPLLETVAYGFDNMPIGFDHVPPATENLALGLGLSIGSDNEPVELPNESVVALSLSIGSDHAAVRPPPVLPVPVVPQVGLSRGSDHSRLTVDFSLSIGSGHEPVLEALPMAALSSSAIERVKLEVQEVDDGPTLELTLGLGSPPPPPPALLFQDQRAVKLGLSDNYFSPKPGSSKLKMEQQLKMKPPQTTLSLDPAAYSPELQEPKPPTPLVPPLPAEFACLALSLSHVPFEKKLIVPGAPVAKANWVQKALEDPKAAAAVARGSCWVDFSTPYEMLKGPPAELVEGPARMLAEPTMPRVVLGMGQPAGAGML